MYRQSVFVYSLGVFIVLMCTVSGTSSLVVNCKLNADCSSHQRCHPFFKVCLKLPSQSRSGKTNKQSSCNCLINEYCHPIFARCLPILTPPSTRNSRKPTAADCKKDSDCRQGMYCHRHHQKCLDVLSIPTLTTTKSSRVQCSNDSSCLAHQYCHSFFKICLEIPSVVNSTTTPRPKFVCSNNTDCKAGYYCHNMTNVCFKMRTATQSGMPSTPKKGSCRKDSDCNITEFCYRIFKKVKVVVRHRRKCRDRYQCSSHRRSHHASGACVPREIQFDPLRINCSSDKECGHGRCCLKKLGVCRSTLKKGQPCVTKDADFTCACSNNLFCKPNSKGRKLRGRRLERKLKIPKYIRQVLLSKGLSYHRKYTYGRCQHVVN